MKLELLDYQNDFFMSEAPVTGLISGVAVGKTYVGAVWAALQSLKNPNKPGIIASGSYPQLRLNVIESFNQHHDAWGFGFRHVPSKRQVQFTWTLPSGKHVHTHAWALGLEEPNNIRGASVPWVYLDEARQITKNAFTVLMTRLREGKNPLFKLTSTPNGFDWLYDLFLGEGNPHPGRKLLTGIASWRNPWLPKEFVPNLARNLDPTAYAQEAKGLFVNNAEGRVYHQFERAKHVSEKAEYAPGLPLIMGWDFNLLGSVVLLQSWQEEVWVFDEIQIPNSWTPNVIQEILRRYWEGCFPPGHTLAQVWTPAHRPKAWVVTGDATGWRHTSSSRLSDYDHIRKAFREPSGRPGAWEYRELTRVENPSVRDRLNTVNTLLQAANGAVRLTIHPRCTRLIRDLEQVTFQPGGGIEKRANTQLTHLSDGLGYACYALFPLPGYRAVDQY